MPSTDTRVSAARASAATGFLRAGAGSLLSARPSTSSWGPVISKVSCCSSCMGASFPACFPAGGRGSAVHFQQFGPQFALDAAQFRLGGGPLGLAVGADLVELVQRGDQLLVG